jgi:hypothetical protein
LDLVDSKVAGSFCNCGSIFSKVHHRPADSFGEAKRPPSIIRAGYEPGGDGGPARGRVRTTQPAR